VLLEFFVESPGRGADVTGRVPLPPVLLASATPPSPWSAAW
jgi:hypothetical protein